MAAELSDYLKRYDDKIAQLGPLASDREKYAALEYLKDWSAKRGLNLTQSQLEDLIFPDKTKLNRPKKIKRQRVNSITSTDPNAIYGPIGYTAQNFIPASDEMSFLITFENVDTALAPAQYVRVVTKLDSSKYDLNSLALGNISIAGNTYFFPGDRGEYFRDVDLRPAQNYIVRVLSKVDTITGEIVWHFTTLDPITKQFIEDPFGGFLPPNDSIPEGEGSVSFRVRIKENIPNATPLSAQAEIFFDDNESIFTNTWTGQPDRENPQSSVMPNIVVENDTVMKISYSGSDNGSGIEDYYLRININEEGWLDLEYPMPLNGEFDVIGTLGYTYDFFVYARDSVGNEQDNTPNAQASVALIALESPWNPAFELYPNPNNGDLNIRSNGNFAETEVNIYSVTGQHVYKTSRNFLVSADANIQLPQMASGSYLVYIKTGSGKTDVQKLLIVRQRQ